MSIDVSLNSTGKTYSIPTRGEVDWPEVTSYLKDLATAVNSAGGGAAAGFTVNVKDYGAKGDGTTDDTTAIGLARSALQASGTKGGALYFPAGTYSYSATLQFGVAVSQANIRIVGDGASTILKPTGAFSSAPAVEFRNCDYWAVANLVIDGAAYSGTGDLLLVDGCSNGLAAQSTFKNSAGYGINISKINGTTAPANNIVATTNTFANNAKSSVFTAQTAAANLRFVTSQIFNVMDYGADPTGTVDSLVAFNSATTAALVSGGKIVVPAGLYKLTGQWVVGRKFVNEADCGTADGQTIDYPSAASYSSANYAAALLLPQVSIEAHDAVLWWGGSEPSVETAILYWGLPNSGGHPNPQACRVEGLTFAANASFSGGVLVNNASTTPPTTKVTGFFAPGAQVVLEQCYARDTKRGIVLVSCYWSDVANCGALHCVVGQDIGGFNAGTTSGVLRADYCTTGFAFSGQGWSAQMLATEQCATSLYISASDGSTVYGTYFEAVGPDLTDYQIKVGDGTTTVVETAINNSHLSSESGKSCLIRDHAQLAIGSGAHWYPDAAHGVYLSASGGGLAPALWVGANTSIAVDPTSPNLGNLTAIQESIRITQGIRCAGPRDTTNAGVSGIVFGRAGWACDAASNLVGLYQDNSSTPALQLETFSGRVVYGHQVSITAHAGGGQGGAVTLDAEVHFLSTVASAGDSVVLPIGVPGMRIVVFNNGANAANVFPATGKAIDALGTNTAYSLAAGASREFWAASATQWYSR